MPLMRKKFRNMKRFSRFTGSRLRRTMLGIV
jgi:hypothetical protein